VGVHSHDSFARRVGGWPTAKFPPRPLPQIWPDQAPRPLERQTRSLEDHTSGEEKTRLASQGDVNSLSHRIRRGIERAKKRGVRVGRPPLPIDPKKVKKLAAQKSLREVAEQLGCSKSYVERILLKYA